MSERFHNPYHFVPVGNTHKTETWQPYNRFFNLDDNESGHWSHKRYAHGDAIHHGRIVCRLTTETPIFIGGQRIEDGSDQAPALVGPFELDDKPAIPASSLRGLISSLAEAASNSAMRVLEDKLLSRRMNMMKKESLKAIGMLKKKEGTDELELLPLILPVFPCNKEGGLKKPIPKAWETIFKQPTLKVYLEGYRPDKNDKPKLMKGSFLEKKRPKSFSSSNSEYWYLKLGKISWEEKDGKYITGDGDNLRVKTIRPKGKIFHFLSGQIPLSKADAPIDQKTFDSIENKAEKSKYTRGILRVLGIAAREKDIPKKKLHEIFIPYEENGPENMRLCVKDALKTFSALAEQRRAVDETLPYLLKGMVNKDPKKIKLSEGDLVFFSLKNDNSSSPEVAEIAISQNWRKAADGTVYEFFTTNDGGGELKPTEYLPFNNKRRSISPAESVFGFVENRESKDGANPTDAGQKALAYAGRVRFSHGIWYPKDANPKPYCMPIPLKILDAPKPPSPALYFKMRNHYPQEDQKNGAPSAHISKEDLNPKKHAPQGRKFYLHKSKENEVPWETRIKEGKDVRFKQKAEISPIRAKQEFWFHVDFDNLDAYELGMLLYALAPCPSFRHKLGMGKPLGLGAVRIESVAILGIDRQRRYRQTDPFSDETRYHWARITNEEVMKYGPARYRAPDAVESAPATDWASDFRNGMDPAIRNAIELIGDPGKVKYRVHTPLRKSQRSWTAEETKTYEWFSANDELAENLDQHVKNKAQSLTPITEYTKKLPYLKRN